MATVIVFNQYGGPDVLEPVEMPDPVPGPGQLRIRVRAAGVQPFDCATRRGEFASYFPLEFPARLGNEVAGIVDRLGPGVTDAAEGDEVIAFMKMEGYADTVIVAADQVAAKPAAMPWEQAGVLSASGQTAHTALDELAVAAGDTVLIHAAAGGVGSFAVQIAHARGATVIGTASPGNHDYLRSLGATPVTYGAGLADRVRAAAPHGVDAALDAIGGEALDISVELLASTERIVTIADWAGAARLGVRRVGTQRSASRLTELTRLYTDGLLAVSISKAFPLAEAPGAHREVETGHVRGKVLLSVN